MAMRLSPVLTRHGQTLHCTPAPGPAMAATRPYLASAFSFTTTTMTTMSSTQERPHKRRLSSVADVPTPLPTVTVPEPTTLPSLTPNRSFTAFAPAPRTYPPATTVAMDPSPEDPSAVFIRPPFTDFPGAPQHPEGLTYVLMSEHADWFLDARDFKSPTNGNPDAIAYPSQLEPPRGWCPAKKRDLKQLGADGWPEGEEPRLRCTFCRRTYAGVNAKSMWRRHVYEKHKIAMANRREGTERLRGRHSNKENKKGATPSALGQAWDSQDSTPPPPEASSSKSVGTLQWPNMPAGGDDIIHASVTPTEEQTAIFIADGPKVAQAARKPKTPPLTPQAPRIAPGAPAVTLPSPSRIIDNSIPTPLLRANPIPESPYNPLATPSFRHSPPRLPSDQPWRFPSPTHPLHCASATELTLTSIVRGDASPFTPGLHSSPGALGKRQTPGGASPSISFFRARPRSTRGDLGIFAGERSPFRSALSSKATPRRLFSASSLRTLAHSRGGSADLSGELSAELSGDTLCFSDIHDSWDSVGAGSLLEPPIDLPGVDPFDALDGLSPADGGPEESPVLRKTYTTVIHRAPASSLRLNILAGLHGGDAEADDDDEFDFPDRRSPATPAKVVPAKREDLRSPLWDDDDDDRGAPGASPPPAKKRRLAI